MIKLTTALITLTFLLVGNLGLASQGVNVKLYLTNDKHRYIGDVYLQDSPHGLLITPNLYGLSAGVHGFHIHQEPDCGDHGLNAKGHLDPEKTDKHLGPYNDKGHLGDLPVLIVDKHGKATLPLLAPRLTLKQVLGHSLMVHAGGDNYSDHPEILGGGGARLACGIISNAKSASEHQNQPDRNR